VHGRMLCAFARADAGSSSTEYALIIALIGMTLVAALNTISGGLNNSFDTLTTVIAAVLP
jgi:Flp pilus assembly pilin Flp